MTELKVSPKWKNRIMRWTRYLIIVFTMWTISLSNNYVSEVGYQWLINAFQIVIIVFTIMYEEYTDYVVEALEIQLKALKAR